MSSPKMAFDELDRQLLLGKIAIGKIVIGKAGTDKIAIKLRLLNAI